MHPDRNFFYRETSQLRNLDQLQNYALKKLKEYPNNTSLGWAVLKRYKEISVKTSIKPDFTIYNPIRYLGLPASIEWNNIIGEIFEYELNDSKFLKFILKNLPDFL